MLRAWSPWLLSLILVACIDDTVTHPPPEGPDMDSSAAEAGMTDADVPLDAENPQDGGGEDGGASDSGDDAQVPPTDCEDATDCNAAEPVCGESGTCGACESDSDCAAYPNTPACGNGGTCGECSASEASLCSGETLLCDTGTSLCVSCLEDSDCSATAPVCDGGSCGGCSADADCAAYADTPACGPAGACVECSASEVGLCDGTTRGAVCDSDGSNSCVECVGDGDCSAGTPLCIANACEPCSADASLCDSKADTPACDAVSGDCVECAVGDDAKCTDAGEVCLDGGLECVECNVDADCSDPTKSRCDANVCVPCSDDSHCAGLGDADVCEAGTCVDCRLDPLENGDMGFDALENSKRELGCAGSFSCDPTTNLCTSTERGSAETCEPCVSDSECPASHRCIEMFFQSASEGGYCMKDSDAGCSEPYAIPVDRESFSGESEKQYCGVSENTTSCDAVLGLVNNQQCISGMDSECASSGGICRTVGVLSNRCTYACSAGAACPAEFPCSGGYCGGP